MLGGMRGLAQRGVLGRRVGEQEAAAARRSGRAQLVHPVGHRRALVLQRQRVPMVVDRAERLVQLDVRAVRQPLDDARLDAVLEYRPVTALQADGPPIALDYKLYKKQGDGWKVYDVIIEGVSLVQNYRSSFGSEIRRNGLDALIAQLAQRNTGRVP